MQFAERKIGKNSFRKQVEKFLKKVLTWKYTHDIISELRQAKAKTKQKEL